MSFDFKKPLSHYYKLSPKKTWLKARLEAFLKEIKDWGLPTNINFQFGDEWYYAEGSNLISIPFYLSDPALARSLSLRNCLIEGLKPHDFNKLLRHEYGHYFDTAFGIRRNPERRVLFGKNRNYPDSYLPKYRPLDFVEHLPKFYSQSHPDEDFAESFALAISLKNISARYPQDCLAHQKLLFVSEQIVFAQAYNGKAKCNLQTSKIDLPGAEKSIGSWISENQKSREFKSITFCKSWENLLRKMKIQNPIEQELLLSKTKELYKELSPQASFSARSKQVHKLLKRVRRQKAHHIPM